MPAVRLCDLCKEPLEGHVEICSACEHDNNPGRVWHDMASGKPAGPNLIIGLIILGTVIYCVILLGGLLKVVK